MEEDNPGPTAAVEIKILDPNTIADTSATNSGITNTTGVYDNSNTTTTIFKINPTTEAEPDYEHECSDNYDDDEGYDDDDDEVKEVEPPEKDKIDLISIEINDEDSNDKEVISEEEEYPVLEHSRGYPTRDRKQVTRLIPTLLRKNNESRHIHLKTDITKEER